MEIALTWDLVVIVFFLVVMAYSFIVGQNGTIKIILSSYIALLASNGLGNLVSKFIMASQPTIKLLAISPEENVILFKLLMFIVITLILVLKGGFIIDLPKHPSAGFRLLATTMFGFLSAGLIVSTILVFVAGTAADGAVMGDLKAVIDMPHKTLFVEYLISYYNFWFAAPAVIFVAFSMLTPGITPIVDEQ